jgi:hypothetical protein
LWTTFTRFEPAADIYAAATMVHRNRISYIGPIVIDARMKPWYPDELFCDDDTKRLVDGRWNEYFSSASGSPVPEMGSSDEAHLYS